MAIGEQSDQEPLHHTVLPDDHSADLTAETVHEFAFLLDLLLNDLNVEGLRLGHVLTLGATEVQA